MEWVIYENYGDDGSGDSFDSEPDSEDGLDSFDSSEEECSCDDDEECEICCI